MRLTCTVNGTARTLEEVPAGQSLLLTLREQLGLPGSKNACEEGECGSCTVYLDELPVCACLVATGQVEGRSVRTVEGLATEAGLDPVQQAFLDAGAVQCGFCTPAWSSPCTTCCGGSPTRRTTRSGRRWPATCAAAPATR